MTQIMSRLHLPQMTAAYGMTETSPISTQTYLDDPVYRRTATVGAVHPHVEICVLDPDGRVVPRGTDGELCVRGYSVMRGYWNDDQATRAAIDSAGWMHTGDLSRMGSDGYVPIIGRIKDMIIRGGENIYPKEIEDLLARHPAIETAQIVGIPHAEHGEEVMAWVKPRPAQQISGHEIREFCAGKIAHFKVPKHIHVMAPDEEFPMTATGKIKKNVLKERAALVVPAT